MREMTVEAWVEATPEVVWADLTRAELLVQWYWPSRFETTAEIEPVAGGHWRVRSEPAGLAVDATVLEEHAPESLRLRWQWEGESAATDAGITLEPAAGATRVIVRHSGFVSDEERQSHIDGWESCLQRLVDRHGAGSAGAG